MCAAHVREACGIPGTSVRTAFLCRDKPAMKEVLREGGIPTAQSTGASTGDEVRAFAAKVGFPLIIKPRDAAGASGTLRADNGAELEAAIRDSRVDQGARVAVEEFIEGHEGFYDTMTIGGRVVHEFICHYYPNVLEAMRTRWISPQFITTNRIDSAPAYQDLKVLGEKVIQLLDIGTSATHMEWFYGPKGLKFSEIGCRPPGVRAWDLYSAANDVDLYKEWAMAIVHGRPGANLSRRYAAGIIALRPTQDGRISGYAGLDDVHRAFGQSIIDEHLPPPGTPTQPVAAGYMANAWLRMKHPDYDELRRMLDVVGQTVQGDRVVRRPEADQGANRRAAADAAASGRDRPEGGSRTADLKVTLVTLLGPQRFTPTLARALQGVAGPIASSPPAGRSARPKTWSSHEHLGERTMNLHALRPRAKMRSSAIPSSPPLTATARSGCASCRRSTARGSVTPRRRCASSSCAPATPRSSRPSASPLSRRFARWTSITWRESTRCTPRSSGACAPPGGRRSSATAGRSLRQLEKVEGLAIAGGHVAILVNRMRLFDLDRKLAGKAVFAWSAGAMAIAERVVLFHHSPPQGYGNTEVLEHGLGLVRGLVLFPHARRRLALDDRRRVALLARRFAPGALRRHGGRRLDGARRGHGRAVGAERPSRASGMSRLMPDGAVIALGAE